MPRKQDVGVGQNPEMLTLLNAGATIAFGHKVLSKAVDAVGAYITAVTSEKGEYFSLTKDGVLGAMLFLEVPRENDGMPFIIEDNPSMFQILRYGGAVYHQSSRIWSDGDDIYLNDTRIGEHNLVNQGIALRAARLANSRVGANTIKEVQTNIKSKEITIKMNAKSGRQDIMALVSKIFAIVGGACD